MGAFSKAVPSATEWMPRGGPPRHGCLDAAAWCVLFLEAAYFTVSCKRGLVRVACAVVQGSDAVGIAGGFSSGFPLSYWRDQSCRVVALSGHGAIFTSR